MKILISLLFTAVCFAQPAITKKDSASQASIVAAATMKPETKERLLVFQAQLNSINQAIEQSELGKRREAITEKFQAVLATGRAECKGGEPTFGSGKDDGTVICQPKETAKAEVKPKE